jgi:lipoprotein-anchoring transpeptidase ErfK/SrfK
MKRDDEVKGPFSLVGVSRRTFLLGAAASLAGCMSTPPNGANLGPLNVVQARLMYAPDLSEPHPMPGIDVRLMDPRYYRQEVSSLPSHIPNRANSIVVDPSNRFLYYVEEGGRATRYGVGVGREGFGWSGSATVGRKAEWPTWTPPAAMMRRDPDLRQYAGGMPGGIMNPLGARAMYLYQGSRDTLYRLHGTNEPWSIGQAMSSGCIRLLNQDIIHLYNRTSIGTRVTVLAARAPDNIA